MDSSESTSDDDLNVVKSDRKSSRDDSEESRPKTPLSPDSSPASSQPITNISVKINTNAPTDAQLAKALLQPFNRILFPNYTNSPDQPNGKPQAVSYQPVSTAERTEQVTSVSPDQNVTINATTVVMTQPTNENTFVRPPIRQWKTGLCNICADTRICCCSFFCFRCFACCVARDLGESKCVPLCVPGWLVVLRTKLRLMENIEGSVLGDCCTACWCPSCTLCQIAREVKAVNNPQLAGA
ncbi:unnamed protein product [Lymnaea stagnalis]|uniref:Cornifelin n=1 Tax=Lymnaea stagnalis TaxID=6523 RepID=A0AAV2H343_LYMST